MMVVPTGSVSILANNWRSQFDALVSSARTELILCSPFITNAGAGYVESVVSSNDWMCNKCLLLTDLSSRNLVNGATDPDAIVLLLRILPNLCIFHLPRLHAKVYVADRARSIISSGNLTYGGICRNLECGVLFDDSDICSVIGNRIAMYSTLGAEITPKHISTCCSLAQEVRPIVKGEAADRSLPNTAVSKMAAIDDLLLERRLSRGPIHAVFADTILYLLTHNGPMATVDLHTAVQMIHPDLCDDTIDRIIDGKRFGKKWKHAVRSAQQRLKQQDAIVLEDGKWKVSQD